MNVCRDQRRFWQQTAPTISRMAILFWAFEGSQFNLLSEAVSRGALLATATSSGFGHGTCHGSWGGYVFTHFSQ